MSQDRELDKYLEGNSEVSQLYADLPEVELPAHLDAAILAEAHRAVNARPGLKPKRKWAIPLGMVATLFVAVMIGLQLPYMLKDATQPEQYKEERIAAMMDKNMAERSYTVTDESKKTHEIIRVIPKEKAAISRDEPVPMAAEAELPVRQKAPALAASPVAVPAPATTAKRMELRESADFDSGMAPAKEKKFSGQTQDVMSDTLKPSAPAATTMVAPAPVQLNHSLMQSIKDDASDASLTPEEWLVRIRRLKQDGKLNEAKDELAKFKKRYPDYPVSKELEVR